jgi:phage gpG-like protein
VSTLADAFTVDVQNAAELLAALEVRKRRIQRVFVKSLKTASELVVGVVRRKLRGEVLHVQTGRLWQSVGYVVDSSGAFSTIGTNVEYARRHEYGFSGDENVSGHFRTMRMVFGRRVRARQVYVAPFVRHASTPERPYMRPSLRESRSAIERIFLVDVAEALGAA